MPATPTVILVPTNNTTDIVEILIPGIPGPAGPAGPSGSGGPVTLVVGETPTGLVNNSNATYATAYSFAPGSVELFINGIRQKRITHFTTSGTTTVLITDSPVIGDLLQLNYERA